MCTISIKLLKASFCLQVMCEELGSLSQREASEGPKGAQQTPGCGTTHPALPALIQEPPPYTLRATSSSTVFAILYVVGCSANP